MHEKPLPRRDPLKPKGLLMRLGERLGQSRAAAWILIHVGTRVDPWLMRLSRGRVNVTTSGVVLILHHVGAKTGKLRKTPVAYFHDGDDVILIASNGGADEHPAWLGNIRKTPEVELWRGNRGGRYRARVASPEERARLWPIAVAYYRGFTTYQARAGGREIQVVICTPVL